MHFLSFVLCLRLGPGSDICGGSSLGKLRSRSQPAIPAIDSRGEPRYIGNRMVTNKTLDHIFGALADARVGKISSFDIYFDCAPFPK